MPIKLPSIPEPGNDLTSVTRTVRAITVFLSQISQNSTGVGNFQFFERGIDSTDNSLRAEVAKLRAEFEAYKKSHP
jgi:hypothetical protein